MSTSTDDNTDEEWTLLWRYLRPALFIDSHLFYSFPDVTEQTTSAGADDKFSTGNSKWKAPTRRPI